MKEFIDCIEIDDQVYPVQFQGFAVPMQAQAADKTIVTFLPWTYREHLLALEESLTIDSSQTLLDAEHFSLIVMKRSRIPESYFQEFKPLALWWASGMNDLFTPEEVNDNSEIDLGPVKVTLSPWTRAEQLSGLNTSLKRNEKEISIEVIQYLDAMVHSTIKSFSSDFDLQELDSQGISQLLPAVVAINQSCTHLPETLVNNDSDVSSRQVNDTLKICSRLGWTPSQVWNTPAREIDHLLRLIDLQSHPDSYKPNRQPSGSKLAAFPDAEVIHFEDTE